VRFPFFWHSDGIIWGPGDKLLITDLGVVIAALFMWLTPWPSRFYADPGVSVLIGIIIFAGSVPLSTSAATHLDRSWMSRASC
jgi:Co/Zn/Cd efflux system component